MPQSKDIVDKLIRGALKSISTASNTLSAIEEAAGVSISMGITREQFVGFVGDTAGMLYDTVAARRTRGVPSPLDVDNKAT